MKILVADDDFVSRTLVVRLLEKMGYEVIPCENGSTALDILLGDSGPRIAILDWMMPDIDGPDIIRKIREKGHAYPYLILLTNRTETSDKVEGLSSGADDYLVKPVTVGELHARVQVGVRFLDLQDKLHLKSQSLIRLEREQKNISLANMAGGVAHHLNNKLQAVIGFLDLLQLEFKEAALLNPAQEALLNQTRTAALEASGIGRNMLSYLSQNHGKYERIELKSLCASVLRDLSVEFPALRELSLPTECDVTVFANPNEIYQVFFQVLKNAMEANPGAPPLIHRMVLPSEKLFEDPPPYPHICSFRGGNSRGLFVKITIHDRGPGITPTNIPQVFDPFFTTKFTGRGLGLAVTMGILKKIDGGIRIGCPREGGTLVEIALPLLTESDASTAKAAP